MPIKPTVQEIAIAKKLSEIKKQSGSHSPSFSTVVEKVPEIKVKIDCCFLSNPYATDLFLEYFEREVVRAGKLRSIIEYYPPQNKTLSLRISRLLKTPPGKIFIGNGATEIIQAALHNFAKKKVLVCIPTFSPYIEFVPEGVSVVFHQLQKENDFKLSLVSFLADVEREKPDTVVIVNPNNPDGGYVEGKEMMRLLESLRAVDTVIVDESFIHFAGDPQKESVVPLVEKYKNMIVVKSLSKDFGVAGVRLGYAVMSESRVEKLLAHGYLWNVSGFGEYFLRLFSNAGFLRKYEKVRVQFNKERDLFFKELSKIEKIKVYPSHANFFLVELLDGSKVEDFTMRVLVQYGIYMRPCKDKVGLSGEFVRIASRRKKENEYIVESIKKVLE